MFSVVRLIELLMIRGLSEVAFVVRVVGREPRVLVWLALEVLKRKKMGESVYVSI